jgi:hypothetical protein
MVVIVPVTAWTVGGEIIAEANSAAESSAAAQRVGAMREGMAEPFWHGELRGNVGTDFTPVRAGLYSEQEVAQ